MLKRSKSALVGFLISSVIFHAVLGSTANAHGAGYPIQVPAFAHGVEYPAQALALSQLNHIFERPDSTALTVLTDKEMDSIKGAYPWWWKLRSAWVAAHAITSMFITRKWTRIGDWNYRFHFDKEPHYFGGRKIKPDGTRDSTNWSRVGLGGNRRHWQITRYKLQKDENGQLTLPAKRSTEEHIRDNGLEYRGIKGQPRSGWRVPWGKENPPPPSQSSSHALSAAYSLESDERPVEEQVAFEELKLSRGFIALLKSEIAATASSEAEALSAASTALTPLSVSCSGTTGITDLCRYPSLTEPPSGYVAPDVSQRFATTMFSVIQGR